MGEIGLSTKIVQALCRAGITQAQQLRTLSDEELRLIPGIGPSSLIEIRRSLSEVDADFVKLQAEIRKVTRAIEKQNKATLVARKNLSGLQAELEILNKRRIG